MLILTLESHRQTNTKESSSHQDSPSSCLDGINEIMFNDKAQKGKKSSLSLSSRKRKKTSFVHDQLEPDHVFSSKSQSESSGTMDQLSPLSDSPIHYTSPPSVNLVEDVSSPTSSNSEVVCIATQDSGAITSAMSGTDIPVPEPSGALQQPIPLSYPPTAAQTFEEPENIDLKEKHDNDIPSNNTDEAEVSSSRRAAQPVGGNEDNEGSEARKRNIASVMPDILRNIPVNIIHLDDGPETSPGLIKKKNKLSLSRTKRQKHQN
ncbi:hypothetical protein BX666DRAFT_860800 [Dichotomocladium elegans]|nr:hypothetical protein BX666DRAFT_860800 [Dichotomocladium elegans]